MSWHLFNWQFQLCSPLHVGYHKTMHLFRTRPYVPGRQIWAALTAKLTLLFGLSNYQKVGSALEEVFRFGYLYPSLEEGYPYIPCFTKDKGLTFGWGERCLTRREFEKKFLSSTASVAIDPQSFTVEEGMLYQVEFVSPYLTTVRAGIEDYTPVYLKGLFWVCEAETSTFQVTVEDRRITMKADQGLKEIDFAEELAARLQVGGERRNGFGLLKLKLLQLVKNVNERVARDVSGLPGDWHEDKASVYITLEEDEPVWGHVLEPAKVEAKGLIEPLVSRSWDSVKGAGQKITSEGLAWAPGSLIEKKCTFEMLPHGLWKAGDP